MQLKHNTSLVPAARQLRKEMTQEERRLWYDFLKDYPVRFLRQKVIGRSIVDFYCASANLVIELDGMHHQKKPYAEKDAERTVFLETYGLRVIRITNNEINNHFPLVCQYIDSVVKHLLP